MYLVVVRVRKIRIRHIYGRAENVYARHYVISCKKLIYRKLTEKCVLGMRGLFQRKCNSNSRRNPACILSAQAPSSQKSTTS
jgi:hypothetical protein